MSDASQANSRALAALGAGAFVQRLSREGVNVTPTPDVGSPAGSAFTAWPVKVTGPASVDSIDTGLYPGIGYIPDVRADVPGLPEDDRWTTHVCWVRALPGQTLAVGAAGLGRLVGWHRNEDNHFGRPVYSLSASGGEKSYGDVIGPDCARTGQLAMFTDPSGRYIGPSSTLSFYEETNVAGGTTFAQHRTRFAMTIPGTDGDDPYPALPQWRTSRQPEWAVNTWVLRDAIDPTSGRTPVNANISSLHKSATQFITVGVWGEMNDSVTRDYVYDSYSFAPGGGLCFYFRNYAFKDFGTVMAETVWYETTRGTVCKHISGQLWARHCSYGGKLGITAGTPTACFEDGLFVQQGTAIAALAGGATLADTVTKVNEISARLKTLGLIS